MATLAERRIRAGGAELDQNWRHTIPDDEYGVRILERKQRFQDLFPAARGASVAAWEGTDSATTSPPSA